MSKTNSEHGSARLRDKSASTSDLANVPNHDSELEGRAIAQSGNAGFISQNADDASLAHSRSEASPAENTSSINSTSASSQSDHLSPAASNLDNSNASDSLSSQEKQSSADQKSGGKLTQQALPLAFVDGEPFTAIPQDLYIPPDALSVILQAFEGPLDLLLYLIRKQNMDILNIDVASITKQYMEYIDAARTMKFELAAEYLLMAAMLAEIKSRMLLPSSSNEDEDELDPRAELIRRLQNYERYKTAAEDLDELPRLDKNFVLARITAGSAKNQRLDPDVSLDDLLLALKGVLVRSDHFTSHHIAPEVLSTRARMAAILSTVSANAFSPFESFFLASEGRQGVVVTFLAIMELVKEQLIDLVQVEGFGAIHIKGKGEVVG